MSERVRIDVEDHVATVTMVRGDKHNALDGAMFEQLTAAAVQVGSTPGVRAVVLHGDGPSFCSGLDLGALAADGGLSDGSLFARDGSHRGNLPQQVALAWVDVPVPVIAAIHGACIGGGMQIALGADIRIAHPDARLSVREIYWGLVPDMGISETLPRLIGIDVAKELSYTGRILLAKEGQALGLVTQVAKDPLAAAQELAATIAGRSPDAIRAIKQLYDRAWSNGGAGELELETELQLKLIGSPNQQAAVISGMTGEPPQFTDPGVVNS
jgi:enoyl-CoA hydratase/carnithine racemase